MKWLAAKEQQTKEKALRQKKIYKNLDTIPKTITKVKLPVVSNKESNALIKVIPSLSTSLDPVKKIQPNEKGLLVIPSNNSKIWALGSKNLQDSVKKNLTSPALPYEII